MRQDPVCKYGIVRHLKLFMPVNLISLVRKFYAESAPNVCRFNIGILPLSVSASLDPAPLCFCESGSFLCYSTHPHDIDE